MIVPSDDVYDKFLKLSLPCYQLFWGNSWSAVMFAERFTNFPNAHMAYAEYKTCIYMFRGLSLCHRFEVAPGCKHSMWESVDHSNWIIFNSELSRKVWNVTENSAETVFRTEEYEGYVWWIILTIRLRISEMCQVYTASKLLFLVSVTTYGCHVISNRWHLDCLFNSLFTLTI